MNHTTLILSLIVIFLIISSTVLLYQTVDSYEYLFTSKELELSFYSNTLDESKTSIFVIGNSQVWRVNMTYINQEVSKFCSDCEVYNLATAADKPDRRIKTISPLIELKPDLVLYGIGYPDFVFHNLYDNPFFLPIEKPDSILPDPESIFRKTFITPNFPNSVNPKYFSLNLIKNLIEGKEAPQEFTHDPTYRVFKEDKDFDEEDYLAYNNEELLKKFLPTVTENSKIDSYVLEKNIHALKKIIEQLENNGIKVILFSTPTPNAILEKISSSDNNIVKISIEELLEEKKVNMYFLHEKFSDMPIWSDPVHITLGKEGLPYAKEIIKIIKNEVTQN